MDSVRVLIRKLIVVEVNPNRFLNTVWMLFGTGASLLLMGKV
jgi:hypothetical protein